MFLNPDKEKRLSHLRNEDGWPSMDTLTVVRGVEEKAELQALQLCGEALSILGRMGFQC